MRGCGDAGMRFPLFREKAWQKASPRVIYLVILPTQNKACPQGEALNKDKFPLITAGEVFPFPTTNDFSGFHLVYNHGTSRTPSPFIKSSHFMTTFVKKIIQKMLLVQRSIFYVYEIAFRNDYASHNILLDYKM